MSTIYSDAAGNKYLGDCRWGNHDINYPSTSWLKSVDTRIGRTTILSDLSSLFTDMSYSNSSVAATWPTTNGAEIFRFSPIGESASNYFQLKTNSTTYSYYSESPYINTQLSDEYPGNGSALYPYNFDYVVCAGSQSLAFRPFLYNSDYTKSGIDSRGWSHFYYWGKLLDVNANFNYYNASFLTQSIIIRMTTALHLNNPLSSFDCIGYHYIAGNKKTILESGRATYAISCSDGQTPGSQWATDLWVYDNNATLGYPVIGRVQNMLLGIGSYILNKPVKIQGSVFPDGGSPWYLPVGTYAGKTLLMRCYSSVT